MRAALGTLSVLLASCVTTGSVRGRVLLAGVAPEPRRWQLEESMAAVAGSDEYVEALWRVDADAGVAACVVTLRPLGDTPAPDLTPVEDALYEKVGPAYEPRVLAVPAGSSVLLRNRDSPCNGFVASARRNRGFNTMITAGNEQRVRFTRPEALHVTCSVREYMRGAIVVVGTPYHQVTGEGGTFAFHGLAPGTYDVRVWHEALGWVSGYEPVETGRGTRAVVDLVLDHE